MKYLVELWKGESMIVSENEFVYLNEQKAKRTESVFFRATYLALSNIAKMSEIKERPQVDDRSLLPEKSQGKPLSKDTFEKVKADIQARFKPPTK